MKIVAVNTLGYVVPLNFVPDAPLPKSYAVRGYYEWAFNDVQVLVRSEAMKETFQIAMPGFGV